VAGNIRLHSLNDVKLVGRLTRDPDLRFTTQGTPVCHFRIAVGRKYKDRASSEWKEEVAFVGCSVWREAAERCGARLKKGSPVFVEGRLKSKEWTTKEGQKRSDLEVEISRIQFLEATGDATETEVAAGVEATEVAAGAPVLARAGAPAPSGEQPVEEEEVPF
jgi:single-strand DNA-binding protein